MANLVKYAPNRRNVKPTAPELLSYIGNKYPCRREAVSIRVPESILHNQAQADEAHSYLCPCKSSLISAEFPPFACSAEVSQKTVREIKKTFQKVDC
jgi:hypothetical protein